MHTGGWGFDVRFEWVRTTLKLYVCFYFIFSLMCFCFWCVRLGQRLAGGKPWRGHTVVIGLSVLTRTDTRMQTRGLPMWLFAGIFDRGIHGAQGRRICDADTRRPRGPLYGSGHVGAGLGVSSAGCGAAGEWGCGFPAIALNQEWHKCASPGGLATSFGCFPG